VSFSAAHDAKQQVHESVDIVDLVGSYIDLRRQGRIFVGLCPWHDDARPSLQVNPDRRSWRCWVCNIGGDVFSFVMQREGVEFREALKMLAERAGISLPTQSSQPQAKPGSVDDKQTLYQAMAWAQQQFHDCLVRSSEAVVAREYFHDRKITSASIERYRLGFAPDQWQWLVDRSRTTEFSSAVLETVGLIGRSSRSGQYYDRFKGRVIFPIRDLQGRAIALGGRILPAFADERAAKYINSPETRLFSKSEHLYGLDTIRDALGRRRHIVVVEGYTDALIAWQSGVDNVAAVLGTALGPRHVRLLRRLADTITLVLDGDEAGQRRTNELLELFISNQIDVRIATLPQGLDPCDFLLQRGADAFGELLSTAVDALEHKLRAATAGFDPAVDTHRANQALEDILGTLAKAPRLGTASDDDLRLRRQQLLTRVAREFRVDESELRTRLSALRRKSNRPRAAEPSKPSTRHTVEALDAKERELLELLSQYPALALTAAEWISADDVASPAARTVYLEYLRLVSQGIDPQFGRVLTEIEDPALKNMIVELDDNAQQMTFVNPEQTLLGIVDKFKRQQTESKLRQNRAALEGSRLDEDEELKLLMKHYSQLSERQGISAPTDG
jgi:DNA primase